MNFWKRLFGIVDKETDTQSTAIADIDTSQNGLEYDPKKTIDLGWYWSETKDHPQMAKISEQDRSTHFYVIGATGTGKTKFLEFLIQQDIEKGNGFGVIDPHGDLIESIKGFYAKKYYDYEDEKEISERVILIDPTDPDFTVTFNPLESLPGVSIAEQVNELISSFRKIWSDSWGTRMEDLMRNSLISLSEANLTLEELSHFLTDRTFREVVLEKVKNPIAKEYFQRFNALTDRGQISWIEPIMNKINAIFSDERIRQIFSSPKSSFNFRDIIDNKKVLLVKLDKGRLKDSADLLGSLLMAKIQMAAFSRSDISLNKRTPFYLYIDEFQNFATESFSIILSEARKYGLRLIMSHQTLSQIPDELRSLILGNTGIQVYFRLNRQDASLLCKEAFDYSGYQVKTMSNLRPIFWSYSEEWEHKTEELQNLPPRFCYVKHKIEGGIIPIKTENIDSVRDFMDMNESQYQEYLNKLPLGRKYLVSRKDLSALAEERHNQIKEQVEQIKKQVEIKKQEEIKKEKEKTYKPIPEIEPRKIKREPIPEIHKDEIEIKDTIFEEKEKTQHQYLQNLIKRMAEEKGYKAVIEQSTPDGLFKIDVSLERSGKKIACEISITTTKEQELSNIEKCIRAGYEKVIMCSSEKRNLERIRSFTMEKLGDSGMEKVLFFQPEELFFYLEQEEAQEISKEQRVKGYKVRVQYQPVSQTEKKTKREIVSQVILGAFRRLKGKS